MKFIELAANRYSVRAFSNCPIEPEKLDLILKAAQLAPTAGNYQPQQIYVIESPEAMEALRSTLKFTYGAPIVLLVCADKNRAWHSQFQPGYDSHEMDASIVCTHMMLEAADLGLGSVWVRGFDEAQVARTFRLPAHIRPVCMLPIGYPSDQSKPAKTHEISRPLSEMVEHL